MHALRTLAISVALAVAYPILADPQVEFTVAFNGYRDAMAVVDGEAVAVDGVRNRVVFELAR